MDVETCRGCRHWSEFVALMEESGLALVACCCSRFGISYDHVITEQDRIGDVKRALSRHGRKRCSTFQAKAFRMIVDDGCSSEMEGLLGSVMGREPPVGCPYYAEHVISGLTTIN